jgi:acyl-coenzyme A thioesterase PaaI-like protein
MADEIADKKPFDPASNGWEVMVDDGFIGLIGPFWRRKHDESGKLGFLAEPRHKNMRGVVQGGMIMSFLDRALGSHARLTNDGLLQATAQLNVSFIDRIRIGEFAEAVPRIERIGRSLIFVSGTINVGERLVATAQGIWKYDKP